MLFSLLITSTNQCHQEVYQGVVEGDGGQNVACIGYNDLVRVRINRS